MRSLKNLYRILCILLLILLNHACKKDKTTIPDITTTEISSISYTAVTSGGDITNDGGTPVISRGVCWSTEMSPTLKDFTTQDGAGTGKFNSKISGLQMYTEYYIRAYATNSIGTGYGMQVSVVTLATDQVADIDANIYNSVTIGSQVWMKRNLRVTKYNDGTAIIKADPEIWFNYNETVLPCFVDDEYNGAFNSTFEHFYNFYAVTGKGEICPTGWHLPSDSDWTVLENYLGGNSIAGGKLKNTIGWDSPNTGATNESGFSASAIICYPVKPAVMHGYLPAYYVFEKGKTGYWWSSSGSIRHLQFNSDSLFSDGRNLLSSIRCLKDYY